ncbi:hypothetical protein, partial [Nostoc sp.]
ALRSGSTALDISPFLAGVAFSANRFTRNISGVCMQSSDAEESIKTEKNTIYSVVLDASKIPEIVEGEVQEAIFTGTQEECQNEILMSLMLD